MKKIGIMGGTFDPVHNGHLLIAENACEQLELDEVRFIPTGQSPHKQGKKITNGMHRLRMVELAIADNPVFVADDRELRSAALSYSYITLQKMHEQAPDDALYFIMGLCVTLRRGITRKSFVPAQHLWQRFVMIVTVNN